MTSDTQERPQPIERPSGMLSKVDPHLIMYHDARALHAEQYRTFRTNLVALNKDGGPKAIVITSSMKGEGKSVTAANLSACIAELPATRVCLVDTDFRAPSQATLFGLEDRAGITELLGDEVSLRDVLRATVVPGLEVLGPGREPDNPARLLGSERFVNLVNELKRRYSWVIIDTPPVNPYTDACVLATISDGAVLVVRMNETPRALVSSSLRNMESAGGRMLGLFLTGLEPDRDDSPRYGYYRVDPDDKQRAREDRARLKAKRRTEKALVKQEKAYLRKQKREEPPRPPDL